MIRLPGVLGLLALLSGLPASLAGAPLVLQFGSTTIDYCKDLAVDGAGNVILAGYFSGTVDFDPGAGTTELTAVGVADNFLAKYGAAGALQWAVRFGGVGADLPHSVRVDSAGDIYAAGYFSGVNVDFDPGPGQTLRTSNGLWDVYVAKFTSAGGFAWVVTGGGSANDEAFDLRLDPTGNVYVIGSFEGTLNLGGSPLVSAGARDIFMAKFSTTGAHVWSARYGDTGADNGYAITVDGSGNVFAAGAFSGSVSVGGAALANAGGQDIYLARYDTSGAHTWSGSMGGTSSADLPRPGGIEVDDSNRLYLCGSYGGLADFNPSPLVSNTLTSTGSGNFFVARYRAMDGVYEWALGVGGAGTSGPDGAHRMAIDPDGNVYVTGFFTNSNVDFDPGPGTALLSASASGAGTTDVFVAKYTVDGTYAWAHGYGPSLAEDDLNSLGGGIELTGDNGVLVAGRFFGTVDWDPGPATQNRTPAGESDMFLVKYTTDGALWDPPNGATAWILH